MAVTDAAPPDWAAIKGLFSERDVTCMRPRGFDLDDYARVKADAEVIFDSVANGSMPPGRPWPPENVTMLRSWIDAGSPETAPSATVPRWTPTTAPRASSRYDDIWFADPRRGWAVNSNGQILRTEDGGAQWRQQFQTPVVNGRPKYLRCIAFADDRRGWAGATSGDTPLFETSDGGATWAPAALPDGAPVKVCGLAVVDAATAYAAGSNDPRDPARMMKTVDAGRTWSAWSMEAHAESLIDVHFFDASNGVVVGGRGDAPTTMRDRLRPVVLATTDGGKTWTDTAAGVEFPFGEWGWKIDFVDRSVGFVSLENFSAGAILATADGGRTWERRPVDDPQGNKNLEGLGFLTADHGWVGGWGDIDFAGGFTSATTDGGESWRDANEVGKFINRFRFFADEAGRRRQDVAYACGETVYKLAPGDAPAAPDAAVATRTLLAAEPVDAPAEEADIDFAIPAGTAEAWLHVWDRFGVFVGTVAHLVDPAAGPHVERWDGRDDDGELVEAGIYLYRLSAGDTVESGLVRLRPS